MPGFQESCVIPGFHSGWVGTAAGSCQCASLGFRGPMRVRRLLGWDPFPSLPPAQVAMDRMKKIKRQLSMTLRGGRGIDKTNGAPEQIGLDESGGGGGSDLGEAPTRAAPGEPRSVRGPLSSAPGGSTDHSRSYPGPQGCCLPTDFFLSSSSQETTPSSFLVLMTAVFTAPIRWGPPHH